MSTADSFQMPILILTSIFAQTNKRDNQVDFFTVAVADPVADLLLLRVAAFLPPVTPLLPLASRLCLSRHFKLFCKSSKHELNVGEAAEL